MITEQHARQPELTPTILVTTSVLALRMKVIFGSWVLLKYIGFRSSLRIQLMISEPFLLRSGWLGRRPQCALVFLLTPFGEPLRAFESSVSNLYESVMAT